MRRFLPVVILSILGCHETSSPVPDEAFAVNGRPVHPACLVELSGALADRDRVVAAVDVEGCPRSTRHSGARVSKSADGWRYENGGLLGDGFFCYWWLGMTPQGTHVVLTAVNGGGSGVYYDVHFVSLKSPVYMADGRPERRWMLSSLGRVGLGDRTRDRAELESGELVVRSPGGERRRIPIPAS